MTARRLTPPPGYDFARNPRLPSFAAQLDDPLALLRAKWNGLETRHQEWQPHREWTVYHLLEHFRGHYGQTLLPLHLMRDPGVWVEATK